MGWLPGTVAERAQVRVEAAEVPDAMASEVQIEQVLVNLVVNAALAIPDGRRGEIVIRVNPGALGMVRLEVSDNGKGMPPNLMERIFEPFFTTRSQGKGTGLGLSFGTPSWRPTGGRSPSRAK